MGSKVVNAKVRMVEGMSLIGEADSGHQIFIDVDTPSGGMDKGPGPMELVLMALGGCTSMDVISILNKMREKLTELEVSLSGQRAAEDPMVYQEVHMHYRLTGKKLSADSCRRAIELSQQKYCSVLGMISKTAKVKYDWEISEG